MALQTTEEQIKLFVEMAPGLSRSEAIQRIRGNNNSVEQAINEYYDNPSTNKYTWDEDSLDSEIVNSSENHGISFNLQRPNVSGTNSRFGGAPSRPPSRANNFPLNANTLSFKTEDQSNINDQDTDLAKALSLSAQEAGLSPQVIESPSTSTVHFGPATRELYDSSQWSMVPIENVSSRDFIYDPELVDRKREPGVPAFLKPGNENHYLGALVTIYHEIPLIRNVLLNSKDVLHSYGNDKQWWMGKPIEVAGAGFDFDEVICSNVGRELQRLMAFLDKTERSYGSIEALANLPNVRAYSRAYGGKDKDNAALEAWRQIFQEKDPDAVKQIYCVGVPSEEMEQDERKFGILELTAPYYTFYENLYDICDEYLWPELCPLDLAASPYLSHVAEVVTFKIDLMKEQSKVTIPATWYPDRYLKSSRQVSLEMRKKKKRIQEQIELINNFEDCLTNITLRDRKSLTVKSMFEIALRHQDDALDDIIQDQGAKLPISTESLAATNLGPELRKIMDSVDRKLYDLNMKRKILYTQLRQLSSLHKTQNPSSAAPQQKPYFLRGVCTLKNILYICQRTELANEKLASVSSSSHSAIDQWWRIEYLQDFSPEFTIERTTEGHVLAAANQKNKNMLLVYASEKALSTPKDPLPKPLETFVNWDNALFNNEINGNMPHSKTEKLKTSGFHDLDQTSGISPNSPGKRKFDYGDYDGCGKSSSDECMMSIEASPRNFEEKFMATNNNSDKEEDKEKIIFGLDPSCLNQRNDDGNSIREMKQCSNRTWDCQQGETVDEMDLDFKTYSGKAPGW
ncbi:unnamed protein product [Blumeria hordei]|uniref:Ubiquitin interaction motif protein n=1 Tax=Blumeria hordei TaxID=2867405 RepID=A0A383UWV6_BLUHO|nr:unnamed protein product [Blumeria hordei]